MFKNFLLSKYSKLKKISEDKPIDLGLPNEIIPEILQENIDSTEQILKNLELKVYVMERCGYCVRLKEVLKDYLNVIELRDSSDLKWRDIINEIGITGFPTMISEKNGKVLVGYRSSIDEIIKFFTN